jgi:hypothetical protein
MLQVAMPSSSSQITQSSWHATWFNQEDVVYYFEHTAADVLHRILDFKELRELRYDGSKRLANVGAFTPA